MDFKEFVDFCRANGVLKAECGEMKVELKYEPKIIDLREEKDDNNEEKENEDILFHSVNR